MAIRWTKEQEHQKRRELYVLYVEKNLTIGEISGILDIAESTVFERMRRLGIKSDRDRKPHSDNKRTDVIIPDCYNSDIAEFFGIMLGDGNLTHYQVSVTLGTKEEKYVEYVSNLMKKIFCVTPHIHIRKEGYRTVYIGSTAITRWLQDEGLVFNKVKSQVGIPEWIFCNEDFMKRFLRGFFDTDGSVYALSSNGNPQISLTNRSIPILKGLHKLLRDIQFTPSRITTYRIYVTRKNETERFFKEISPKNTKHIERYNEILNKCVGMQAVNSSRL